MNKPTRQQFSHSQFLVSERIPALLNVLDLSNKKQRSHMHLSEQKITEKWKHRCLREWMVERSRTSHLDVIRSYMQLSRESKHNE